MLIGLVLAAEKCGQYNFRCINSMAFEICEPGEEDDITDPPITRQCPMETHCNEDDPSYCSPIEDSADCSSKKLRSVKKHKKNVSVLKMDEYGENLGWSTDEEDVLDISGLSDDLKLEDDDANDPQETTTEEPSKKCEETYMEEPAMNCEMYGFYPDNENKTLFYFCDLKCSGKGFILRHMQCNEGRVFDPMHRACVIPGTIRNIRDEELADDPLKHTLVGVGESSAPPHGFNCSGKEPGKYPDPTNCHQYHLCLPFDLYAPFQKLTVQCPKRTAFDPDSRLCTRYAIPRCYHRHKLGATEKSNIDCPEEMRFREHRRDCQHYYLCFRDRVMRIKCPEEYEFNDRYEQCLPSHLFNCE